MKGAAAPACHGYRITETSGPPGEKSICPIPERRKERRKERGEEERGTEKQKGRWWRARDREDTKEPARKRVRGGRGEEETKQLKGQVIEMRTETV